MEHVNGWCCRGIYKGGLWEDDLHVSAQHTSLSLANASINTMKERYIFNRCYQGRLNIDCLVIDKPCDYHVLHCEILNKIRTEWKAKQTSLFGT